MASDLEAIAREPSLMTDPALSFEPHRRHLRGLAYRMLGSLAEAEDAVQTRIFAGTPSIGTR